MGTVKVGVLFSTSGTMASSEKPLVDATLMACREINDAGGVLGLEIETVILDGESDPEVFARQADRLLTQDRVSAIFGCWTSASRKVVKPLVETHLGVLFYPGTVCLTLRESTDQLSIPSPELPA